MKPRPKFALAFIFAFGTTGFAAADWDSDDEQESKEVLSQATRLLKAERYADAAKALQAADRLTPNDPDILSLLGFSHRSLGDFDKSAEYYEQALWIMPNHRGALAYQGKLFLSLKDKASAEKNVKLLQKACPDGCSELVSLRDAIAKSE